MKKTIIIAFAVLLTILVGLVYADLTGTEGLAIDLSSVGAGTDFTIAFDPTELLGNRTWGDASTDTIVWTWDRATGTDLTMTVGNAIVSFNGTVTAGVGFDVTGAADVDYGSADVTDHTFLSDGTGTGEFVLKAGAIDGTEILDDTVDSADYAADSIDNEHINWADIDNLGDEGAVTLAATLTITDNESTAENNALIFTSGGDLDGGDLGLECDGTAYYTPSTGTITTTEFVGGGSGLTAIDGEQITNDTIDNDSIDWGDMTDLTTDGAVSWGNIAEGELANSTVVGADIKDDTVDSADYAAGSIDYEHLADDIISGAAAITAFESGDTFLILEAGVGLREADYDDLPSVATAYDDIADPDAASSITFADGETVTWATAEDSAGSFFTIDDSDAALAANTYLLHLLYSVDDAEANADYLKCEDAGGVVLTIQQDGDVSTTGTFEAATITEGGVAVYNDDEMDVLSEITAILTDVTAFITDDDMPAVAADPDIDAAGEIGRDSDGANETGDSSLRGHDGSNQFLYSRKLKTINFTLISPDTIDAADLIPVWHNTSGMTFTIVEWKAWSDDDDVSLEIEELTDMTNFTAITTVDAVEIATDGTGVYYASDSTITHAAIEHDHSLAIDFDTSDTPDYVQISITGWFNADVD